MRTARKSLFWAAMVACLVVLPAHAAQIQEQNAARKNLVQAFRGAEDEVAYPFKDPYQATVFGTPPKLRYTVDTDLEPMVRSFRIENRRVPDVFWYADSLDYSLMLQDGEAPLLFLVAGTGAGYDASKMLFLQRLLHAQGWHVACLTSPTHFTFVTSASRYATPGFVPHDVADLYRVMRWVDEEVKKKRPVSGYAVGGYSLGGMHAAFLAELDSRVGAFGFSRVLMLNPAVDLYGSALRFDSWMRPEANGGRTPEEVLDGFINKFADLYKEKGLHELNTEVLMELVADLDLTQDDYRTLIGSSFRLTSASMIFTADVCLGAGYVKPADVQLTSTSPLLPYYYVGVHISFEEYVDEFLVPYLQFLKPGTTKEGALAACRLEAIQGFLAGNDAVRVIGTEDDPILGKEDLAFLRDTFGERLHLLPHGGHCGNMFTPAYAERIMEAMQ